MSIVALGTTLDACTLFDGPAPRTPVTPAPSGDTPDLVFRNANVLTMDADVPTAEAVAIVALFVPQEGARGGEDGALIYYRVLDR